MKPFIKYALASLALAAAPAFAAVDLPSTGNGELALFVRDLSNPTRSFMVGLGVNLDSLLTQEAITATPGTAASLRNGQPIAVTASLPTFSSSELATFMSTSSSLGYEYAIIGGDTLGTVSVADAFRYVGTNELQYSASLLSTTITNQINDSSGIAASVEGFFGENNDIIGAGNSTQASTFGIAGTNGATAPSFFGANFGDITAAVGTATNLYMLTSGGTSAGNARIYQFADVLLSANGTLTSVAVGTPVPLPAAVWLLGSALVGFSTVRRRRNADSAAVAA